MDIRTEPRFRALFVDYGGVMTTSMTVTFAAFCATSGVDPGRLREVLVAAYSTTAGPLGARDVHDLVRSVETGAIQPEEFDRRLADALSVGLDEPIDPTGLTSRLFGQLGPDGRMREAVRTLRARGVTTGLISNTWGVMPPDDVDDLFDVVVLSGRERVRKPDREIFLLAAKRAVVAPEEAVFVDDIPVNVEGARRVGMAGVLHRDAAITVPRLEELFGAAVEAP